MCFLLFEAASADVVEEAISRAALGRTRVVSVVEESAPAPRRPKP
jgi:hypothetical protein